jgi:hypothetical protein
VATEAVIGIISAVALVAGYALWELYRRND